MLQPVHLKAHTFEYSLDTSHNRYLVKKGSDVRLVESSRWEKRVKLDGQ